MRLHRVIRLVLPLVAILALGLTPLVVSAAPPEAPAEVVVRYVQAPDGLKMRTGAGLGYGVVRVLAKGEAVHQIAGPVYNSGINWVKVRAFRWGIYHEGWVASNYLSGGSSPTYYTVKVMSASLNLRSGPGYGYGVQRTVPYGTLLSTAGVTQWSGGRQWTRVAVGGNIYWAATAYLARV